MNARHAASLALLGVLWILAAGPVAAQPEATAPATNAGEPQLLDASLIRTTSGGVILSLTTRGTPTYHAFMLEDPSRVVLDMFGYSTPAPVRLGEKDEFVRQVRYASRTDRHGAPMVRYVIETAQPATYDVKTEEGALRLTAEPLVAPASTPAATAPDAKSEPEKTMAPAPAPAPAKAPTPAVASGSAPVPRPALGAVPAIANSLVAVPPTVPATSRGSAAAPQAPVAEASKPAAEPAAPAPAPPSVPAAAKAAPRLTETPVPATAPQLAAATPAASASTKGTEPAVLSKATAATMSLDVQNADVRTVFRSIAQFAGVNIVADNNVSSTVTIRALQLPWPEMLEAVCRSAGLIVIGDGPVIRVATQRTAQDEALARESSARKQEEVLPLETRVLPVHYANVEELQETLAKIGSDRGQVQYDSRTNTLIVTDIAPRLEQLEAMVRRLDTETVQVEIAAKIVDVDETVARQLGISWGGSGLHSGDAHASGSFTVNPGEVLGASGEIQVGFLRSFGELEARLQLLEDERKADIVSAPRITTVDNRMARILVGKQVPLITQDFAGNAITELKKVGITLEVTPHINAGKTITLDLHPEISDLASVSTTQSGIIFTTTEADTRVLVGDGQTAVIGGLIRDSDMVTEVGIPLLKDIPLVGRLFKNTDHQVEKRELLIFVTPRIVQPVES